MVLHIYRGWWCLKDQRFLSRLIALQDDAEVACNGIVSISVGEPTVAAAFEPVPAPLDVPERPPAPPPR